VTLYPVERKHYWRGHHQATNVLQLHQYTGEHTERCSAFRQRGIGARTSTAAIPYLSGTGYNEGTSIPSPEGCEAKPDATSFRSSRTHSGGGR